MRTSSNETGRVIQCVPNVREGTWSLHLDVNGQLFVYEFPLVVRRPTEGTTVTVTAEGRYGKAWR